MKSLLQLTRRDRYGRRHGIASTLIAVVGVLAILIPVANARADSPGTPPQYTLDPETGQATFTTAGDAAEAFALAVAQRDTAMLGKLLGSDYREVLPLDGVDSGDVEKFIAAWESRHTLQEEADGKRLLAVGVDAWTLPIPIAQGASGWYFDIPAGLENMRIRRIGRNELATIQAVLAYYDAQLEYAEQDRNGDGALEYAQRFLSTPGTHDGLYWDDGPGGSMSPLGPLLADQRPDGGYHGYYYRILRAQGDHAPGGPYSYMIGDRMKAGFAVIAWPVTYGETGVMSFMVSQAGIVYEQDLGPDSASLAGATTVFDPGPGWTPVTGLTAPPPDGGA
jgi:hypothetical protein